MTDRSVKAVDTNVLIYLHDQSSPDKRAAAKNIVADNPKVPAQVVSEYLNTIRRLLPLPKAEILYQTAALFGPCEIIPVTSAVLLLAAELVKSYHFQLFDAIIVAACLKANCAILFSEDMQHGLVVNHTLTIVNPFF